MSHESLGYNDESIPLKERNLLQYFIGKKKFPERPTSESEKDWNARIEEWFTLNAKTISEIIDNPNNKIIRDLTMAGKYKEASDLVLVMIGENEEGRHAIAA